MCLNRQGKKKGAMAAPLLVSGRKKVDVTNIMDLDEKTRGLLPPILMQLFCKRMRLLLSTSALPWSATSVNRSRWS
jgi:hypothetical protein